MWTTCRRAALALLVLFTAATAAAAEPPDEAQARERARQLLREGNELLGQGRFVEALACFERAYEAFPSPRLHLSLGVAHDRLGHDVEALTHYQAFVRDVPAPKEPANYAFARGRIIELDRKTATLDVQVDVPDALVTLDGRELGATPLPGPVRIAPGAHVLVVGKPGHERQVVELALRAGDREVRRIQLLTEAQAAAKLRAFQEAEARRQRAEQERRRLERQLAQDREAARARRADSRRQRRLWGTVALGAGAALGATSATLAWTGKRASDRVEGAAPGTPWSELRDDLDRAETLGDAAWVTGGLAGALAITGGVLLYLGRDTAEPAVAVAPNGGGLVIAIRGRF